MRSGNMSAMSTKTVHTFCRYCLASCGIEVTVEGNRVTKISADKQNPHTWRDFCAKGRTANQLVEHPRRILNPMRRVGDTYVEATWDEAIADIAARMNALIDADGPDAIGVYYGNPAGFSSSNIIFMNGWLDAVGTNSRYFVGSVDQNAMHVVATAMYGSLLMAPVSDIDNCDYFLLVGTNPAVSAWNWLETVPGGWRRALDRQKGGATIVVVDPLRTESAEHADVHLAVRPGQDWALLLAMVKVILDEGLEHNEDCAELATGVDGTARARRRRRSRRPGRALRHPPRRRSSRWRGTSQRASAAMVVTRTGVSLHLAGTIGEWLGHVLNVITGRMDRPGGRRFEPGYVDTLRMSSMIKASPHTSRLLGREMVAGAHALSELPDEITTPGPGQIRAMVINCGNPVVSGPDGGKLDKALEQLDLLVAIDFVQRESHRHAHWLLPAVHWLERDDLLAFTSSMHDEPYVQYGAQGRRTAAGARVRSGGSSSTWRSRCASRCSAPRGSTASSRRLGAPRDSPARQRLEFGPHWIDRLVIATGAKGQRPQDQMARHHGASARMGVRDRGSSATSRTRCGPTTRWCTPLRPSSSRAPANCSPNRARWRREGYPFQLANRRHRHSMNSWLNELPGLHPSGQEQRGADQSGGRGRRSASATVTACGCSPRSARSNCPRRVGQGPRRGRGGRRPRLGLKDFRPARRRRRRSRSASTATCSSTAVPSIRCRRPRR